jgi:hypothetical protein
MRLLTSTRIGSNFLAVRSTIDILFSSSFTVQKLERLWDETIPPDFIDWLAAGPLTDA